MEITEHVANSHSFKFMAKNVPLLIVSDIHFDAISCQRDLLKKHFDQIKEKNGHIIIIGDWFDVMGCERDPRSKSNHIRHEYLKKDASYLDLIVHDSFEFLKPYLDQLLFMSYGNHETAIMKHRDTDILNTLVFLLRNAGSKVVKGGYSGFINFNLYKSSTQAASYLIAYHHGGGGNAPRSKGILHADMDAKNYPDANMIISGHNHQKGHWPLVCYRRHVTGRIVHQTRYWVKTGTYKRNEDGPLIGGWEVEKKFDPTPLGGYFLDLDVCTNKKEGKQKIWIEETLIDAK